MARRLTKVVSARRMKPGRSPIAVDERLLLAADGAGGGGEVVDEAREVRAPRREVADQLRGLAR